MALDLNGMNLQGKLPDEIGFLRYLTSLDVSDNRLFGVIPSDFRWAPISTLDVSGNQLGGAVPPMLCLKEDINKNGVSGDIDCDHIACAVGSYSKTGYALKRGDCVACKSARFLGSKTCDQEGADFETPPWMTMPNIPSMSESSDDLTNGEIAGIFFGVLFLAIGVFVGAVYVLKRKRDNDSFMSNSDEMQGMTRINPDVEFT